MVWLCTEGRLHWLKKDQHEWTNTKMIFNITQKHNKTILTFTHEGLTPDKESHPRCSEGWTMVITQWLHDFIEHGQPHF